MHSNRIAWFILSVFISTGCHGAALERKERVATSYAQVTSVGSEFVLVKRKQARTVIVLGDKSTTVERHAAQELIKYVRAMSGAKLRIVHGDKKSYASAILIGRLETNPRIRELCATGLVKLSPEYPGLDGFIIKSVNVPGKRYLVLGGSEDRGTLYAVYHLLENVFHVGFFEDGEYIPKYTNLLTPRVDVAERPAFKIREYMQLCSTAYTSALEGWLFPEWQYQADYCAKKKQNLLWVDFLWSVHVYLKRMVEAQYGVQNGTFSVSSAPPRPADKFDVELEAKVHKYIRTQTGLNVFGPMGADGSVSKEFRKAYPHLAYIEPVHLSGVVYDTLIDPRSSEFKDYVTKYLTLMTRLLGTDHYYQVSFPAESRTFKDPELAKTAKFDFAKAVCGAVTAFDPKGVVFSNGWAFRYWTPDEVKQYCDGFTKEHFLTNDMWAELDSLKIYQNCDYFYGKNWLLGTLHSFGGDEVMFGDMQHEIDMYRNILADPKAVNCQGTSIMPEIIHHNPIFWDLLMAVTWNPGKVTVDSQLKDIALRRYGSKSATALCAALKKLHESVYGYYEHIGSWPHMPRPIYRRALADLSVEREYYLKRSAYISKLRQAVTIMTGEATRQAGNKLYDNDLVDICNQFVSEVQNSYFIRLWDAFKAGDSATFESCASVIDKCFENKALILSSNSRYYLDTYARAMARKSVVSGREIPLLGDGDAEPWLQSKPRDIPLQGPTGAYERAQRWVRRIASPDDVEYSGRDRFELIKYYRCKTDAYVGVLREKMTRGDKDVSEADVKAKYAEVARLYHEDDSASLADKDRYRGTVAQASAEVLRNIGDILP